MARRHLLLLPVLLLLALVISQITTTRAAQPPAEPQNMVGSPFLPCPFNVYLPVVTSEAGGLQATAFRSPVAASSLQPAGSTPLDPVDFNGDGCDDLAIGSYDNDVNGLNSAGAVNVIYGTPLGLRGVGNQLWTQDGGWDVDGAYLGDLEGAVETLDHFGYALAACDFDWDGYTDLAIGVPGEDSDAGAVNVIYGGPGGLAAAGNQLWSQDSPGIIDNSDAGEKFGFSLAAARFDRDNNCDLAIGVPGEWDLGVDDAGAVNVIYGSPGGLTAAGNQYWSQNGGFDENDQWLGNVADVPEVGDQFGWVLAVGFFGSHWDLVIGVPHEDVGGDTDAGAINVIYGGPGGLAAAGNQLWSQDGGYDAAGAYLGDLCGGAEPYDYFGTALAGFLRYPYSVMGLAVGVPGENLAASVDAGSINVINGDIIAGSVLVAAGNYCFSQDTAGIVDVVETGDQFGRSLAAGDFNDDGYHDLAVGAPYEDVAGVLEVGAVHIILGSLSGLEAAGNQFWSPDYAIDDAGYNLGDLSNSAEEYDSFGLTLTAGDFDGDGLADLAVGVPLEDIGPITDAGWVDIIRGTLGAGLAITGNQEWTRNGGFENTLHLGDLAGDPDAYSFFGWGLR